MPHVRDVTDKVLQDSSYGPGDHVRRVAKAKPAKNQTPQIIEAAAAWEARPDKTIGFISKPLAYSGAFRGSKTEHSNVIRLIKGGHLKVCEVFAPPPNDSTAKRDSPYGDRYYVLRPSCPAELPEGSLGHRRR